MVSNVFSNLDPNFTSLVLIPLLICLSRIFDVVLGTFRLILIIQGRKLLAAFFGFFEVLIWITVTAQIMTKLGNPFYYVAWALGFSIGTYGGMLFEEKISLGNVLIRVLVDTSPEILEQIFAKDNINATKVRGFSSQIKNEVDIYFAVLPRKKLKKIEAKIQEHCPSALYTIESVRSVHNYPIASKNQINYFKKVLPRAKNK